MFRVDRYKSGEQCGQMSRGGRAVQLERGERGADCSLKEFTVMLVLKQGWQLFLVWTREKTKSSIWQPKFWKYHVQWRGTTDRLPNKVRYPIYMFTCSRGE